MDIFYEVYEVDFIHKVDPFHLVDATYKHKL